MRTFALVASIACALACASARPVPPPTQPAFFTSAADDFNPDWLRARGVDPQQLLCNRENRFGNTVRPDSVEGAQALMETLSPYLKPLDEKERGAAQEKIRHAMMWRMVRSVLIDGDNNNVGAVAVAGASAPDGAGGSRPVVVFRTGLTPAADQPGSCFDSLLKAGHVKHVVNLFDGDIPCQDLFAAEARAAERAGASYVVVSDAGYGPWRDQLRKHYDDPAIRKQATEAVARLIRENVLRPNGALPKGNIHVHCGGGMHRTGMIVGVIERCLNGTPFETVEARYRYHTGWRSPEKTGGAEDGNLRFIREFDCALLQVP